MVSCPHGLSTGAQGWSYNAESYVITHVSFGELLCDTLVANSEMCRGFVHCCQQFFNGE
jgi:hypothetical protein